jgi:protein-arginine kinase activator protein McsA
MSEITVIVCDQCGGKNVHHYERKSKPTITERTMKNIAAESTTMATPAVYIFTTYVLHCPDCNYKLEYSV